MCYVWPTPAPIVPPNAREKNAEIRIVVVLPARRGLVAVPPNARGKVVVLRMVAMVLVR